jgi:hypothetical protein
MGRKEKPMLQLQVLGEMNVDDMFRCDVSGCLAQNDNGVMVVQKLNQAINDGLKAISSDATVAPSNVFGPGSLQQIGMIIKTALPYLPTTTLDYTDYAAAANYYDNPSTITPALVKRYLGHPEEIIARLQVATAAYTAGKAKEAANRSFWSKYKWYIIGGAGALAAGGVGYWVMRGRKPGRSADLGAVRKVRQWRRNPCGRVPCGTRVRVSEGSGISSRWIGTVVPRSEVKTDHRGVPMIGRGHYSPIDWSEQVAIRFDNGELDTMYINRLDAE